MKKFFLLLSLALAFNSFAMPEPDCIVRVFPTENQDNPQIALQIDDLIYQWNVKSGEINGNEATFAIYEYNQKTKQQEKQGDLVVEFSGNVSNVTDATLYIIGSNEEEPFACEIR